MHENSPEMKETLLEMRRMAIGLMKTAPAAEENTLKLQEGWDESTYYTVLGTAPTVLADLAEAKVFGKDATIPKELIAPLISLLGAGALYYSKRMREMDFFKELLEEMDDA